MKSRAQTIGDFVGRAIARDALAEDMPLEWTGLDAQDGDVFTKNHIEPDTEEWEEAEAAARAAYEATIKEHKKKL